jgi:CRISPR-associated protein Csx3
MLKFMIREMDEFTVVGFEIDGVLEPGELRNVRPPEVNPKKGVILTGRGPTWLYGFLVHFYHPTVWVATYDPRIGAVVVESHVPDKSPGDVVAIDPEEILGR